jgi:hypothetical protein
LAHSYLSKENLSNLWDKSHSYMRPLHSPLGEYERIARNRPHPSIPKHQPKNTDGTLASIVQEQPKRIIQQLPTGKVKTKDIVKGIVAGYILDNTIIPNANAQASVMQKAWGITQKALTFGAFFSMTFFGQDKDYFGANFKLIYIKDMFLEPGKLTFNDCNYVFIRAWYQETDIDALIEKEKQLKKEGESGGWDISVLKEIKTECQKKEQEAKSHGESERNVDVEGIEVIHAFQKGIGAEFYSYATSVDKVCRTKVNPDPRGEMPIQCLYANIDFENPLGRGAIEMSGGMQNFIDSSLQAYQYMQGLMMAPPLKMRGNVVKSTIKFKPFATWDMGSNENSDVEPVNINTTAMTNFSTIYGLSKSQILALNNNGDTSISSEVGNPGFSKTSKGVDAQTLKLGISDNYMRKQFETWFGEVCESLLNLHFAEKHGTEDIELNADVARKLRTLDPSLVSEDNMYTINYDEYTEELKFEVDASTSTRQEDEKQAETLGMLLERLENSPLMQQLANQYPEKIVAIWNRIVGASGVEDVEALTIDEDEFMQQLEEQKAMQAEQAQMAGQEQPMDEQEPIEGEVVPPEALGDAVEEPVGDEIIQDELQPAEQGLDEDELQLIEGFQERGVPDEIIDQAIALLRNNMPDEEVAEIVVQAMAEMGETQ